MMIKIILKIMTSRIVKIKIILKIMTIFFAAAPTSGPRPSPQSRRTQRAGLQPQTPHRSIGDDDGDGDGDEGDDGAPRIYCVRSSPTSDCVGAGH